MDTESLNTTLISYQRRFLQVHFLGHGRHVEEAFGPAGINREVLRLWQENFPEFNHVMTESEGKGAAEIPDILNTFCRGIGERPLSVAEALRVTREVLEARAHDAAAHRGNGSSPAAGSNNGDEAGTSPAPAPTPSPAPEAGAGNDGQPAALWQRDPATLAALYASVPVSHTPFNDRTRQALFLLALENSDLDQALTLLGISMNALANWKRTHPQSFAPAFDQAFSGDYASWKESPLYRDILETTLADRANQIAGHEGNGNSPAAAAKNDNGDRTGAAPAPVPEAGADNGQPATPWQKDPATLAALYAPVAASRTASDGRIKHVLFLLAMEPADNNVSQALTMLGASVGAPYGWKHSHPDSFGVAFDQVNGGDHASWKRDPVYNEILTTLAAKMGQPVVHNEQPTAPDAAVATAAADDGAGAPAAAAALLPTDASTQWQKDPDVLKALYSPLHTSRIRSEVFMKQALFFLAFELTGAARKATSLIGTNTAAPYNWSDTTPLFKAAFDRVKSSDYDSWKQMDEYKTALEALAAQAGQQLPDSAPAPYQNPEGTALSGHDRQAPESVEIAKAAAAIAIEPRIAQSAPAAQSARLEPVPEPQAVEPATEPAQASFAEKVRSNRSSIIYLPTAGAIADTLAQRELLGEGSRREQDRLLAQRRTRDEERRNLANPR